MKNYILVLSMLCLTYCNAQDGAGKTMQFTEDMTSPEATLQDVAWMEGHWRGEAFGGTTEEIWSPPLGDSMMFVFKLVADGKVQFYEIGGFRQVDETLVFQLKHFANDFKGWEEKDETVDARLVKIQEDKVFFEGFTFEKINDNEILVHVLIDENGDRQEVTFNYKRFK